MSTDRKMGMMWGALIGAGTVMGFIAETSFQRLWFAAIVMAAITASINFGRKPSKYND
jgi:hypothetical protein